MRGPSAAFSILLSTAALAQTNNCGTAIPFVDNDCFSFSPPRASVQRCYTFTPPSTFVDFTFIAFVPQGTCLDAVTSYALYDDACNELERNDDGLFTDLMPLAPYRVCFTTTCPTNGVVNFLCATEEAALPITLLSFTAEPEERGVLLFWSTATEQDADGFTIQRSTDTQRWSVIGYIDAVGYSMTRVDYSYLDINPVDGVNYYRLISDEDSDVIAVVYRKDHPFRLFNFAGQRIR